MIAFGQRLTPNVLKIRFSKTVGSCWFDEYLLLVEIEGAGGTFSSAHEYIPLLAKSDLPIPVGVIPKQKLFCDPALFPTGDRRDLDAYLLTRGFQDGAVR